LDTRHYFRDASFEFGQINPIRSYMPDSIAIEWEQFSLNCPGCNSLVTRTLGYSQHHPKTICGSCGATVDLDTPEAKESKSKAALAAMKRTMKDADR
jgi:transposase-like protein